MMENITVFTGEIKPRAIQKLRREGYIACVIPCEEDMPEICLLEDKDGSKIIALFTKEKDPSLKTAKEKLQNAFNGLTDVPVIKIEGIPEAPESKKLEGLYVSKDNIILNNIHSDNELILEFFETKGQETDCEIICPSPEFGFKALFAPWEIKSFYISPDGTVEERI